MYGQVMPRGAAMMEMMMQVKMIEGLHLTATNKRHIAEMLTRGIMEGGTRALYYVFTNIEGNVARLTIFKNETNDYGRKVTRKSHCTVEFAQ